MFARMFHNLLVGGWHSFEDATLEWKSYVNTIDIGFQLATMFLNLTWPFQGEF